MKTLQPRVIVAVDPHKQINAVNVVDDHAVVLAREVFPNTAEGHRQLLRLGRRWRQRSWAVEGLRWCRPAPRSTPCRTARNGAGRAHPAFQSGAGIRHHVRTQDR